jgi:hypothetical protein
MLATVAVKVFRNCLAAASIEALVPRILAGESDMDLTKKSGAFPSLPKLPRLPSSPNPFSQYWEKGDRTLAPLSQTWERGWG